MAEVRVIARSVARKGKENQLGDLLGGMLAPTCTESGCKLYELYESNPKGLFYFYEIGESQAALDQHAASPHFKRREQTMPELLQEPFEVNILEEILTSAAATYVCGDEEKLRHERQERSI
jgi:quinol monooxygenase YgiN